MKPRRAWRPQPKSGYQDVPAWLLLILAGRPWPAPRRPPRITSCDSFGGQYRLPVGRHGYEPFFVPLKGVLKSDSISGVRY